MNDTIRCSDCGARLWGEQEETIGNVWPSGDPDQHTWSKCIVRQLAQAKARAKELEKECEEYHEHMLRYKNATDEYHEENEKLREKIKKLNSTPERTE